MVKENEPEFEVEEVEAAGMDVKKSKCRCTSESIGTCHY